jgi:TonB-linked SusC/RagA family outer membrane protein
MKMKNKVSRLKLFMLGVLLIGWGVLNAQDKRTVTGTVQDSGGEPLIGVSIILKGSSTGVITDMDGNYSIGVTSEQDVLVFSYIGFADEEITVGDRSRINVTLREDTQLLEEVVVVGFGTQKKVNLTGAITNVGQEVFENRPVANVGKALQGIVPNLNINISNGAPNTAPSFNVRGGTSMAYDSGSGKYVIQSGAPLILVDGIEMSPTLLNQMNPNDIESMSVIMDASAAAIYGTKAAFGVILVTSKSGKFNQKGKINYSYDISFDTPTALPDLLDAYTIQKSGMDRTLWTLGKPGSADEKKLEAMLNYMNDPKPENAYYMNGSTIEWVATMDPYKEVVRKWSPTHKHNLSFQGGSDRVAYYISLGYQGQEGMYKINTDEYKRYNATARINAKVNSWFNVEGKINYNETNYEAPYIVGGKGSIWSAMRGEVHKNINMPIMTGPNDPIPNAYTDNILAWMSYGAKTKSTSTTTSLALSPEFIILPDVLKVKADLSYLPQSSRSSRRSPKHSYITTAWNLVSEQSEAQEHRGQTSKTNTDAYAINVYADFNKRFAQVHNISAIAGFNQESVEYSEVTANLRGLFSPDILKPDASEDPSLHTITTGSQRRTGRAVFGRINYNYKERYLFEVNGRYDGSSRFTPKDRYFFFPSFSLGWRIAEEEFMSSTRGWLDNLKVKASWGKLGDQPGSYYPYQAVMTSNKAGFLLDDKYVTTVRVPGLVSPNLTWQKATNKNLGLEANLLKNRLSFSFDLFERKTTDILTNGAVAYPSVLGASAPLENSGSIKAYGWELQTGWKDRLSNGLTYSVMFTMADSRTKVLHYAANPTKNLGSLYDGAYLGDIWGYEVGGILQAEDLTLNEAGTGYIFKGPYHSGNLFPGYVWYRDTNGDGKIDGGTNTVDNPGDRRIIGNSTPRYKYGVRGNVAYKGFDLEIFFQGVGKRDYWTGSSTYWGGGAGSRWMYDRSWTPERTDAKFPMYGATPSTSKKYLLNASYLRLKQLIFGYTAPRAFTQKLKIDRLRFHVSGYNLFEISDIPGLFDLDLMSDTYPVQRTVAFGVQIGF